ncbi:hypothetical protein RJ55_06255 [Drechmeria coniospora]|nr:hypothetical protein RJ55_06255 [Drechmeria coniospora]
MHSASHVGVGGNRKLPSTSHSHAQVQVHVLQGSKCFATNDGVLTPHQHQRRVRIRADSPESSFQHNTRALVDKQVHVRVAHVHVGVMLRTGTVHLGTDIPPPTAPTHLHNTPPHHMSGGHAIFSPPIHPPVQPQVDRFDQLAYEESKAVSSSDDTRVLASHDRRVRVRGMGNLLTCLSRDGTLLILSRVLRIVHQAVEPAADAGAGRFALFSARLPSPPSLEAATDGEHPCLRWNAMGTSGRHCSSANKARLSLATNTHTYSTEPLPAPYSLQYVQSERVLGASVPAGHVVSFGALLLPSAQVKLWHGAGTGEGGGECRHGRRYRTSRCTFARGVVHGQRRSIHLYPHDGPLPRPCPGNLHASAAVPVQVSRTTQNAADGTVGKVSQAIAEAVDLSATGGPRAATSCHKPPAADCGGDKHQACSPAQTRNLDSRSPPRIHHPSR